MEKLIKTAQARFDTKLTIEQKSLFERAAKLGGYRTLTHFIVAVMEEKATTIVQQHEIILATERDRNIFFEAIMNPPAPGKRLQEAAKRYKLANNPAEE